MLALLLLLVPTMAINIASMIRGGRWGESIGRYWPLAVFVALGSIAGTYLLVLVPQIPYKLLMAAVLLVYLNVHRMGGRLPWINRWPRVFMVLFGLLAGLLAGQERSFRLEGSQGLSRRPMRRVMEICHRAGAPGVALATFDFDRQPPEVSLLVPPEGASWTSATSAAELVRLQATDPGPAGIAYVLAQVVHGEHRFDGSAWLDTDAPVPVPSWHG